MGERIGIIIQARMASTRLAKKIFLPLAGKPVLQHVIDRCKQSKADDVVIAISINEENNIIEEFCYKNNYLFFRGSENDVLDRHYQTAKKYGFGIIIRITSDCPLISPDIVNSALEEFKKKETNYLSNVRIRSFPRGLDIEIFDFSSLEKAWQLAGQKHEREHVTSFIYNHPELFKLSDFIAQDKLRKPEFRLCIDTKEDYELLKEIYNKNYKNNNININDVIDFLDNNPQLAKSNLGSEIEHLERSKMLKQQFIKNNDSPIIKGEKKEMGNKVFIIAEAGSNWRVGDSKRDLAMAKALIDVAVEAKADAVKFQTYRPETVYVKNAGSSDYLSEGGINDSIFDIYKDLSMPYEMIPKLAEYCNEKGIEFMSTPFSIEDAKAIDPFVKRHKIASYEITHSRLIEFIAKTGKPLILSTGASNLDDIEWAISHFYNSGGKDISIMQCTAKYPAPLSSLNIKVIPELINRFNLNVGLSDRSRDPIIGPISAVSLGASIIEKHFTLDNRLPGPDHYFAITPIELVKMVQAIRDTEQAIGSKVKEVQEEEKELSSYAQRGIQATREIKIGELLLEGVNIDILRPGKQKKGIHPRNLDKVKGKKATRNINLGEGIQEFDFN